MYNQLAQVRNNLDMHVTKHRSYIQVQPCIQVLPKGPPALSAVRTNFRRTPPQPNRITYATPLGTWYGASKTL